MSDPRLSQLFELSNKLEELAESIGGQDKDKAGDPPSPPPPKLPPKTINGNGPMPKTPNGNQPVLPPKSSYEIQYERLMNSSGDDEAAPPPQPQPPPLPPRYSTVSEMSTSSPADDSVFTMESTPSAHSIHLAESLISKPHGEGDAPAEAVWAARCAELEMSLQRFRDQAQNIREMLREKVSYY